LVSFNLFCGGNVQLIVHAGFVLVIPYGILSEKRGGRFVAALNLLGYALSSVWILVVCKSIITAQHIRSYQQR
jgi:hypothetical protein